MRESSVPKSLTGPEWTSTRYSVRTQFLTNLWCSVYSYQWPCACDWVIKGGSFGSDAHDLRSSERQGYKCMGVPGDGYFHMAFFGFRCAADLK